MIPQTHSIETEFGENFEQINFAMEAFIHARYEPTKPVEERFKAWWTAFMDFIIDRPLDMLYVDQVTSTHLYPIVGEQPSMAFYAETRNILKTGQQEGILKNENISLMNQFVRVAITNVVKINIAAGKKLNPDQVRWVINACWDGIKNQKTED